MFGRVETAQRCATPDEPMSQAVLDQLVSRLSPIELLQIEDDIDFYRFSGRPSPRLIAVLKDIEGYDPSWRHARAALSHRSSIPDAY